MEHEERPTKLDGGTGADTDRSEGFLLRGGDRRTLSIDEAVGLLTKERRRALLLFLRDRRSSTVPMDAVINRLAERERTPRDGDIDEELRDSIHIALTHHHVPKLDQSDIIEWDADDKTMRYCGDPMLDAFLDVAKELEGD